jgi:S1-C subfamily serine protease
MAAQAGLRRGDEIVSINGRDLSSRGDFQQAFDDIPSGSPIELVVRRNGRMIRTEIDAGASAERR